MPEYLAPGVYVEEVDTGSKPIEGVSTSTSGMVGVTEWGPVGIPTLVTSFADFQRQFGGYLNYRQYRDTWHLPHSVEGFFTNGGKRVYIVRVLHENATTAQLPLDMPPSVTPAITTSNWPLSAPVVKGDLKITLDNVNSLVIGTWLKLESGGNKEFIYVVRVNGSTITIENPLKFPHLDDAEAKEASTVVVQSIDPGVWGNGLQITVNEDNLVKTKTGAAAAANSLTLQSLVGIEIGSVLEVNYVEKVGDISEITGQFYKVEALNPLTKVATIDRAVSIAVDINKSVRSKEFALRVDLIQTNPMTNRARTIASETHRNLSTDPRHSRYMVKVIGAIPTSNTPLRADGRTDGESGLIRIGDTLTNGNARASIRIPVIGSSSLSDGIDAEGEINDRTYFGEDDVNPQKRSGLFALKNIEEISIVAIPGRTSQIIQNKLLEHCELLRYRFAVLDSRKGDLLAGIQEQRGLYDSKYAALYYPWVRIPDPFPDNPRAVGTVMIPPSGHTIGIYARSDIERGVYKAPANEVIRGIADLEVKLVKEQQDILNPRNINVLRNFREDNRGLRVWGARTLSSDPDWKYVNVRRLFIFIEKSIDQGTQWVVFEPNDEQLWARVKRVISAFLTQVWRDGALMGLKPEQAFFVKCDRTTMTQNDIDNGRLIVLIGIAPVKPAEFVIFRIGQWTGGAAQDN